MECHRDDGRTLPTHVGCVISSELLDAGELWTPLRPLNDNTVDTILDLFLKVAQSKKQNDVSLFGAPFSVTVTTVNEADLPRHLRLKGSGNARNRRRLAPVHHQINERALLKVRIIFFVTNND